MNRYLKALMPARISAQIALLVITALVLAHLLMTASFFLLDRHAGRPGEGMASVERLIFLVQMLNTESDASTRAALLASARRADPGLMVLQSVPPPVPGELPPHLHEMRDRLGGGADLFVARRPSPDAEGSALMVVAKLSGGTAIAVPLRQPGMGFISPFAIGTLVFLASAVIVLSLWAAWQLTAPLAQFADAAERFTADASTEPLAEKGPLEVRRAARALNDMQGRVLKLVADRTRMLAAVSHDLRTPITRLRLRAESIADENLRSQFLRDLAAMQNLVQSALTFLRGQTEPGQKMKSDLPAMVQTVCDDFMDTGGAISYSGPLHLYVDCVPDEMMRAIENLIDNGLKFGKSVAVRVARQADLAIVEIEDDGPGISGAEKARVTEPFYRGDSARNLDTGESFGLGLSIAQAIIERTGGTLAFRDAVSGGLLVRVSLPVADDGANGPLHLESAAQA